MAKRATRSLANTLAALVRDPLVHFAFAGTLLFAGYTWINRDTPSERGGPITIGRGEAGWLRETFASQWRRDPTDDEMKLLIETLVREHLLAREARALGLDRDDTIVRRRLAQKLTFLVEETTRFAEPDESELRRLLAANADKYRSAPVLSFQQIFYSPARRVRATEDARADLVRIAAAELPEGDPLPLEAEYAMVDQAAIASLFGPSFAEEVDSLKTGAWSGPLKSGYGVHLVRVTEREEGKSRSFEEVRPTLLNDWRRQKSKEAAEAYLGKLREKYGVIIDDSATQSAPARTVATSATP